MCLVFLDPILLTQASLAFRRERGMSNMNGSTQLSDSLSLKEEFGVSTLSLPEKCDRCATSYLDLLHPYGA